MIWQPLERSSRMESAKAASPPSAEAKTICAPGARAWTISDIAVPSPLPGIPLRPGKYVKEAGKSPVPIAVV